MNTLHEFFNAWSQWIFSASWQIALFTILVLSVSLIISKKHARIRYALWLLVIVKVVLPPSIGVVWGVGSWGVTPLIKSAKPMFPKSTAASQNLNIDSEPKTSSPPPSSVPASQTETRSVNTSENAGTSIASSSAASTEPILSRTNSLVTWLFFLWMAGIGAFYGYAVFRYARIRRILKSATSKEEGPLRVALEKAALQIGKRNPPELLVSKKTECPFLFGFIHPKIALPSRLVESMKTEEIRNILLHELIHWKRFDVPVGWLQLLVQGAFWFHPFIWLANSRIRHERECACDEEIVLRHGGSPQKYGESLLKSLLIAGGRSPAAPGFPGIFERHSSIRSRLEEIMNTQKRNPVFSRLAWLIPVLFALVFLPMSPRSISAQKPDSGDSQTTANPIPVRQIGKETIEEPMEIVKSVHLIGKSPDASVIRVHASEKPAISIRNAERVILENLTIQWSPGSTDMKMEEPAAVSIRDTDVIIRNCVFEPFDRPRQTPYAVLAAGRTNLEFTDSTATGFAYTVMFTDGANGTVKNSVLSGAGHSVVTLHEFSEVTIENNILGECLYHAVRNTGGDMNMKNNLVFNNNKAGAYLGNKDAHGLIVNNLFYGNKGGIWSYYGSDVTVENNLFTRSKSEGISFWNTCDLKIHQNSFIHNPMGLIQHEKKEFGQGALTSMNHFWENKSDVKNFEKSQSSVSGDPLFRDPENGDFSPQPGSPLLRDDTIIGLIKPQVIHKLWKKWESMKSGKTSSHSGSRESSQADGPPKIVSTTPQIGAKNVDPSLEAITVTFDRDMNTRGYSWTGGGPQYPPGRKGERPFWKDKRTCAFPVDLEPGKYYRIGINSKSYKNFRGANGVPVKPEVIYFTTAGADSSQTKNLSKPVIVDMQPQNGAQNVDPSLEEIRVTFSVPMGSGFSWTGGPPLFPDMPEGARPYWTEDKKTCVLPVNLQPGRKYRIGLNSLSHNNFQSEAGVPLDPLVYRFTTGTRDSSGSSDPGATGQILLKEED